MEPTAAGSRYEILIRGSKWVEVTYWIFRSWTGKRRIDGVEYTGSVYFLGSSNISRVVS